MPLQSLNPHRLLIVVDQSSSSDQALKYVASMVGRRRGFHVQLLHLLPPLPPELLEFGGAEDPATELKLQAQLRREQQDWLSSARDSAVPVFDKAVRILRKAGIVSRNIESGISYADEPRDASQGILDTARAKHCRTIVLGHEAHSWFRGLAGGVHLAEHIIRHGAGFSIWVVQ